MIVFVGLWISLRKMGTPPIPQPTPPVAASTTTDPPLVAQENTQTQVEELKLPDRNPFDLPSLLREEILRRQEAQRQKELAAQAGVSTTTTSPVQLPNLKLQGIFWGVARPQAIINRQILYVGDTLEGCTLTAITREGVKVSFSHQEFFLTLPVRSGKEGQVR